jgi:uncharacterized protein DUF4013
MDLGKPFTYMFRDPRWLVKICWGALYQLLCLVIVGIPVLLGYYRRTFLALVKDEDAPLPEWSFLDCLTEGIPALGVVLCYLIPTFLLSYVPCVGACVGVPLTLAVAFILPAALTRLFLTGEFASAFDFKWIFGYIGASIGDYALAFLVTIAAGIVALFGLLLCVVGIFFTSFWARLVGFHAFAQVWRLSPKAAPPASP